MKHSILTLLAEVAFDNDSVVAIEKEIGTTRLTQTYLIRLIILRACSRLKRKHRVLSYRVFSVKRRTIAVRKINLNNHFIQSCDIGFSQR